MILIHKVYKQLFYTKFNEYIVIETVHIRITNVKIPMHVFLSKILRNVYYIQNIYKPRRRFGGLCQRPTLLYLLEVPTERIASGRLDDAGWLAGEGRLLLLIL